MELDPVFATWLQLVFRWAHLFGGVVWIGFLFFFAFVQLNALRAMGESRLPAARQLMPRALWWIRWMAALTLATGLLLLWLVYYADGTLYAEGVEGSVARTVTALVCAVVAVGLYDAITARIERARFAHPLSVILLAGTYWGFAEVAHFHGRAVWIHVGSAMGLALFVNVWLRVWPVARRQVIPSLEKGIVPNPEAMRVIETRARRSVYVAIPLLFLMISNHYPSLYASSFHAVYFSIVVLIGFFVAAGCLRKADGFRALSDRIEREASE